MYVCTCCSVSTSEKFYLEPLSSSLQETLEIDRLNFELTLIGKRVFGQLQNSFLNFLMPDRSGVPSGRPDIEQREICALIGIIHLLAGTCMHIMWVVAHTHTRTHTHTHTHTHVHVCTHVHTHMTYRTSFGGCHGQENGWHTRGPQCVRDHSL